MRTCRILLVTLCATRFYTSKGTTRSRCAGSLACLWALSHIHHDALGSAGCTAVSLIPLVLPRPCVARSSLLFYLPCPHVAGAPDHARSVDPRPASALAVAAEPHERGVRGRHPPGGKDRQGDPARPRDGRRDRRDRSHWEQLLAAAGERQRVTCLLCLNVRVQRPPPHRTVEYYPRRYGEGGRGQTSEDRRECVDRRLRYGAG